MDLLGTRWLGTSCSAHLEVTVWDQCSAGGPAGATRDCFCGVAIASLAPRSFPLSSIHSPGHSGRVKAWLKACPGATLQHQCHQLPPSLTLQQGWASELQPW